MKSLIASLFSSVQFNEASEFLEYLSAHGKEYTNAEEFEKRFMYFFENSRIIEEHNAKENVGFKLGHNHFSDMSEDEFLSMYANPKVSHPFVRQT